VTLFIAHPNDLKEALALLETTSLPQAEIPLRLHHHLLQESVHSDLKGPLRGQVDGLAAECLAACLQSVLL
jgi:hypothetical protein